MNAKQTARILSLQDYLAEQAKFAHYQHMPDIELDDIIQGANLAIIERATQDPTFLTQTDAYIVKHGIWRSRDAARSERRHSNRRADPRDSDDDLAAFLTSLEDDLDLRITIEQILEQLDEKKRAICLLLADGYRKSEIARMLGTSPQNVGHHAKRARQTFAEALALA